MPPLPASGGIAFSDMNTELGLCCTCAVSMNGAGRYLAKIFTSSVSMCDLYGTDACTSVCNIVIAGGGGGGNNIGGGGGAGGIVSATNTICADTYNVVIGAGGEAGGAPTAPNGSNSCFGSLANACGGGGGGRRDACDGCDGGSGGGGASANFSSECDGGACVTGQGNCGANGLYNSDQNYDATTYGAGGGGGGFSEQPPNATFSSPPTPAGCGGCGLCTTVVTGSATCYAGGGGGGGYCRCGGIGKFGGGDGGGCQMPTCWCNGTVNTGGGGGGSGGLAPRGGQGGSGVVIVAYTGPQRYEGGTVCCHSTNCVSHTFTTSTCLTPRCL